MNKIIVIIGLVILIIGGALMGAGWSLSAGGHSKVNECNTTEGQIKRSLDPDYQTECEAAVAESNMYAAVCMSGVPMLIIGIIVLIFGLVKKDKTAQPAYPPAAYPPQPYPPQQAPPPYQQYPPQQQQYPPPGQYPQQQPPPQQYPPQYPPPPPY